MGPDEHCNAQPGTGAPCDCQHRTKRYGTALRRPATSTTSATVVIHLRPDPPHIAEVIRDIRRHGPGRR
jgi:hypothetical protein